MFPANHHKKNITCGKVYCSFTVDHYEQMKESKNLKISILAKSEESDKRKGNSCTFH